MGRRLLAVAFDRVHLATEHGLRSHYVDDTSAICHRQRHEQVHHRESAGGESLLSAVQTVIRFESSAPVALVLWRA